MLAAGMRVRTLAQAGITGQKAERATNRNPAHSLVAAHSVSAGD